MTPTEYIAAALRTKSNHFHKDLVPRWKAERFIYNALTSGDLVDELKKGLFYGKQTPNLDRVEDTGFYTPKNDWPAADVTHGILGIYTEASELLDELMYIELDKEAVIDETGDLLWYVALLLSSLDVSFEKVMERNIAKLRERYPEKFTEALAMERLDESESV